MKPIYKRISIFLLVVTFVSVIYFFNQTNYISKWQETIQPKDKPLKYFNISPKIIDKDKPKVPPMVTDKDKPKVPPMVTDKDKPKVPSTVTDKDKLKVRHTAKVKVKPTEKLRPNSCKNCFPNNFPILLENKDTCKTYGEPSGKLDLFIIIFTQFKSINRRTVIRNTWTQHCKKNTANARYAFAFGKLPTDQQNKALAEEAKKFNDIVQADFAESYRNLTYKTITMLGWVTRTCPSVKHIMKTDDDMWVNVPKIIEKMTRDPLKNTIAGCCILDAKPIRNKASKWYASYKEYPRNSYPGFCSGTGYVMDINTAINIHKTSVDVSFLYLEDVYVALCIEHLGNSFHLQPLNGFNNGKYQTSNMCDFKRYILTSHYMTPQDIDKIWKTKC